jgi:hypothetical protein
MEEPYAPLVVSAIHAQPLAPEEKMKYAELRKVDVSKYVEKKNGLTYLSWAWAVDQLLQHDPAAQWEYAQPVMFGHTMMVFCTVNAFGVSRTAQLPVMNHRNQAVENPDSFQVNTAMQRCLAKAIALHGLGLYIYNGEDLPPSEEGDATLTEEDIGKIAELAEKVGSDVAKIAAFYKVESLNQIPRTQYGKIIATLNKKRLTNAGVQDNG